MLKVKEKADQVKAEADKKATLAASDASGKSGEEVLAFLGNK